MSYYGPPGGDGRSGGRGHGGDYRANSTTDRSAGAGMRGGDDYNGRNTGYDDVTNRYSGSREGGHGGQCE